MPTLMFKRDTDRGERARAAIVHTYPLALPPLFGIVIVTDFLKTFFTFISFTLKGRLLTKSVVGETSTKIKKDTHTHTQF